MNKNVASQKLSVFAFDSTTNLPKSGDAANITAYVSKDDGAATVLADTSATELEATNAKGYYLFDLAQAETNADKLAFSAKSATSNIVVVAVPAVVYTRPASASSSVAQTGDSYARLGAPVGASISADIAAVPAAVWAYVVENSKTALQYIRVIKAAVAGKLSGAATTTVAIRDDADTKARITATVDSSGNRSAVTIDGT